MTEMRLVFLGTGGAMPSRRRSLPALAIRYSGAVIILDCGEGTQRQFIQSGLGFRRRFAVFITHMHGDHVLGLPGLLYTAGMLGRSEPIEVYGPPGLEDFLQSLLDRDLGAITYPIKLNILGDSDTVEVAGLTVSPVLADHVISSYCYVVSEKNRPGKMKVEYLEELGVPRGPLWGQLQKGVPAQFGGRTILPSEALGPPRKGRKIVYTGDTRPIQRIVEAARGADVLVHDATFDSSLSDKAHREGHSTAKQAAETAVAAGVKRLYLFHVSPRYEDAREQLLGEALSVFPNSYLPEDLDSYIVSYSD